ncbi:hypothetical protein BKA67DRAFT_637471 [Truncatella angustata]|uniref:Uncharacterized protein n=1 Tax=Truncatella angustata TaxID=152316 RepID=A0A9P8UFZ1_9PEZI|nr:uncharacterized protein BKA67DRAFT_637471 [Truncatella angustata]KAH6651428.1 hypothetical protein BKA67DRAFT_637471 [Truncatella angustata]
MTEMEQPANISTITLISGANQGLGIAIAKRLAKEHNHHVVIGSRNVDAGAKVAASLQAEGCTALSTFNTNVFGTVCLTKALLPILKKSLSPRIVFVSSIMGSLAQAKVEGTPFYDIDYRAYDASKATLNMLALNYARILRPSHGLVNIACLGLVNTNLGPGITYGDLLNDGPTITFLNIYREVAW